MKKKFKFAHSELEQAFDSLTQALQGTKANEKEQQNARLLLEELSMLLWENGGGDSPAEVSVSSFLGQVTMTLSLKGEEYNPLSQENIWNDEDENYYRRIIICANRDKLAYSRKNGANQIAVRVHENSGKRTWLTLAAMALGIAVGFILRSAAPEAVVTMVNSDILNTVKSLFLNGLKMIVGPVVFLSITCSIASMTDLSALGRMGGKLALLYSATTLIASFVGTGLGFVVSIGSGGMTATAEAAAEVATTAFSLKDTLLGIIPTNIISPFLNGDMTQVIFISLFMGVCLSILNEKTRGFTELLGQINEVFLKMIGILMHVIPLVAFCAMASVAATLGADSLLVILRLAVGVAAGCAAMIVIYGLLLLLLGRLSPLPFWRKIPSFWPTPMSLTSSNATMPTTIRFCTEQMGISEKVSSFSIPLGATMNMDGTAMAIPLIAVLFMREYGIEITPNAIFTLVVTTFLLTVSSPGVPGAGLICISTVIVSMNIPVACIGIVVGIYQLQDMFTTSVNCSGDIVATAIVSKSEKLMDEAVYRTK